MYRFMSTHNRWMMIILVLMLVSATTVQMVSAAGEQSWYLTGDAKPTGAPMANDSVVHDKDNLMNKSVGIGTWGGSYFSLDSGKPAWFYADTGAECGLGFGENNWTAHIRTESIEGGEIDSVLYVEICKLSTNGSITFLANGSKTLTSADPKKLWNITCVDQNTEQDFLNGEWLSLRVLWQNETADTLKIYFENDTDSDSYITSPSSDPGYPVPELPTIILFSAGLLILAGYVYMGRRNK
jgi:hypothetical protein